MDTGCTVVDCGRGHYARGWCNPHYQRWWRHGDVEGRPTGPEPTALWDRFWEKVDASGDCWEWTAAKTKGYGRIWEGGRFLQAHRVAWELLVGPIPEGLTIDHLCRNRACVNSDHLEPVPMGENTRRGSNANRIKSVCPRGHPYDEINTDIRTNGARRCRTCRRYRATQRRLVAKGVPI